MSFLRYSLFSLLALAFFAGCGDSSSQEWESRKQSSTDKAASDKSAASDTERPHGMTDPHAGMNLPASAPESVIENDGKLDVDSAHWTAPKTWIRKSPSMMLLAEYAVPKAEGDKEDGRLTVSQLGGGVESNIDRWKGQFEKLDKQNQETFELGKLKVTQVDLSGTYQDSRGMMGPTTTRSDYRMIGAVVEVPGEQSLYFIKCYGPAKTIAAHADEIKSFIRSMKVDK
jgi:hypothetical protein